MIFIHGGIYKFCEAGRDRRQMAQPDTRPMQSGIIAITERITALAVRDFSVLPARHSLLSG